MEILWRLSQKGWITKYPSRAKVCEKLNVEGFECNLRLYNFVLGNLRSEHGQSYKNFSRTPFCYVILIDQLAFKIYATHPPPYKLVCLPQGTYVYVTRRTLVLFTVRDSCKYIVCCDVVPMYACNLLFGRIWEFDRHIQHGSFFNPYTIQCVNITFTMTSSIPVEPSLPPSPVVFLQRTPLEVAKRDIGLMFYLITTPFSSLVSDFVPPVTSCIGSHVLQTISSMPPVFTTFVCDFVNTLHESV